MIVDCKVVWREISNYIENDISPEMRAEMEEHLAHCRICTAVLDGTYNIVCIVADDRAFTVPAGFSSRLKQRIQDEIEKS